MIQEVEQPQYLTLLNLNKCTVLEVITPSHMGLNDTVLLGTVFNKLFFCINTLLHVLTSLEC